MSLEIRAAEPGDEGLILGFIQKLAAYEKLLPEVTATEADIRQSLFVATPRCFCEIAFWQAEAAGFALWFYNYSTFKGKAGIYLEDLFVDPHRRGQGIGKALLKHLARRCVAEGLPRLQWSVLDWNGFRITGAELQELAL
jgi:GNAT superfamily N-acetyltransferase